MWPILLIKLTMPFFQQCMFGRCTCGNCWRINGSLNYAWSHLTMPLHYQIRFYLDYTNYTDRVAILGYLLHIFKHMKPSISHVKMYIFFHEFLTEKAKQHSCLCSLQLVELKYIYSVIFKQLYPLIVGTQSLSLSLLAYITRKTIPAEETKKKHLD
jgi:hypothetical protein